MGCQIGALPIHTRQIFGHVPQREKWKIQYFFQSAKVDVEPFWPGLFAGALKDVNVSDLISNIGSGAGSGPATGGAAAGGGAAAEDAPAEEAKKESSSEESDDDMGFGLFD